MDADAAAEQVIGEEIDAIERTYEKLDAQRNQCHALIRKKSAEADELTDAGKFKEASVPLGDLARLREQLERFESHAIPRNRQQLADARAMRERMLQINRERRVHEVAQTALASAAHVDACSKALLRARDQFLSDRDAVKNAAHAAHKNDPTVGRVDAVDMDQWLEQQLIPARASTLTGQPLCVLLEDSLSAVTAYINGRNNS